MKAILTRSPFKYETEIERPLPYIDVLVSEPIEVNPKTLTPTPAWRFVFDNIKRGKAHYRFTGYN